MSSGPKLSALRAAAKSGKLTAYNAFLLSALRRRSSALEHVDSWDYDFLQSALGTALPAARRRGIAQRFPPLEFGGPEIVRNEAKLYFVEAMYDPRNASYKWWYDRRPLLVFIAREWATIGTRFATDCLAEVPSGMRPKDRSSFSRHARQHNRELLELYAAWYARKTGRRIAQPRTWTADGKLVTGEYPDGPVVMIGTLQRWLIIQQEQMEPIERRNIFILAELFNERAVRLSERQKRHDSTLNLYKMPGWMRDAVRFHLLDKIEHGDIGPATVDGLMSIYGLFRDFMYERFESPRPDHVTTALIEDDFVAWGRARELRGHNWFNDTVALLRAAARGFPESWPALTIDPRAVRKIGAGRTSVTSQNLLERPAESRSRAMPAAVVEAIARHTRTMPPPCPLLFLMAMTIGARAEDLHALSFDAMRSDPDDDRFLILHFWQNKVRRWNTKPLLKTDPLHHRLIDAVEAQRRAIIERYGHPTKYLFPVFNGRMEGFCTPGWSSQQFRALCVEHEILDEDGRIHRFGWHSLRHHRGTQMAQQGQDILAIMLELGHVSPDMAMTYVNRRLDLKKRALLEKGGGQFFTIEGEVDHHVAELLMRKDATIATRVAGGACTLPHQLGDWCDHAHACLSCKHFRADASALVHFESEQAALVALVSQQHAAVMASDGTTPRTDRLLQSRADRNRAALVGVHNVLVAIRKKGEYVGTERRFRKPSS